MSTRKQGQREPSQEIGIGLGFEKEVQGLSILAGMGVFEDPNEVRKILRDKWGLDLPPIEYAEEEGPREPYNPLPPPPMIDIEEGNE